MIQLYIIQAMVVFLFARHDGLENAIVIVDANQIANFTIEYMYFRYLGLDMHSNSVNKSLRKYGINYMIDDFKKFQKKYGNIVQNNNGYTPAKIGVRETGAFLSLSGNKVRLGGNVYFGNVIGINMTDDEKTNNYIPFTGILLKVNLHLHNSSRYGIGTYAPSDQDYDPTDHGVRNIVANDYLMYFITDNFNFKSDKYQPGNRIAVPLQNTFGRSKEEYNFINNSYNNFYWGEYPVKLDLRIEAK